LHKAGNVRVGLSSLSLSFSCCITQQVAQWKDAALPRIIGHGVVVDRWIRQNGQWYLRHRVYQQMSINSTFLPDGRKREVAQTP